MLGRVGFFGGLALMSHQFRNADAMAAGFADSLLFRNAEFQHFMPAHSDTQEKFEVLARECLRADSRA